MEIMQVNMPEKKKPNLLGTAQTGMGWYGVGKAVGPKAISWGKGLFSGSEAGGGAAAGSGETTMAMAGPLAVGTAGMAFGAKAEGDYIKKGESSGNAKYSSRGTGPNIKAPTYNYDTINRRMNSSPEQLNPREILDARNSVKDLPLSEPDKIQIGKQLSKMLDFIKIK
jgi:hypothetical protein